MKTINQSMLTAVLLALGLPFAGAQTNNPASVQGQEDITWCEEQIASLQRGIASYEQSKAQLQRPAGLSLEFLLNASDREVEAAKRQQERDRRLNEQQIANYDALIADNERAIAQYRQRIDRNVTAVTKERARTARSGEFPTPELFEIRERQAARKEGEQSQDRMNRAEAAKLNEENARRRVQQAWGDVRAARGETIRRMGEEAVRRQREAGEQALREMQEFQRQEVDVEEVDLETVDVKEMDIETVDVREMDIETVDVREMDIETVDVKEVDVEEVDVEEVDP